MDLTETNKHLKFIDASPIAVTTEPNVRCFDMSVARPRIADCCDGVFIPAVSFS